MTTGRMVASNLQRGSPFLMTSSQRFQMLHVCVGCVCPRENVYVMNLIDKR